MSNSNASPLARLIVTSDNPSLEIKILDSDRDVHGTAVGSLDCEIKPGLYEVQYGVGSLWKSELVALRPQATVEIVAEFAFSSGAPIGPSTYMQEQQNGVAQLASDTPTTFVGGGEGELVVFLRRATGTPLGADALKPMALLDERGSIVCELEPNESRYDKVKGEWAGASLKLDPGGYSLRFVSPADHFAFAQMSHPRTFDQSVWISSGWETLIFIPNSASRPNPQNASIHTVRLGEQWDPGSPATIALETMFACLRDGKGVLPTELLPLIMDERQGNPMLGIASAHSALLSEAPNFTQFDELTAFLLETWPDHPDVRALYPTGEEHKVKEAKRLARASGQGDYPTAEWRAPKRPIIPITWPPMLLLSYQGLLRADAKWPAVDLIADHSFAEMVASYLLIGGLWSAWEPFDGLEEGTILTGEFEPHAKASSRVDALVSGFMRLVTRSVTSKDWKRLVSQWTAQGKTGMLLNEYLSQKVAVTDKRTVQEFVADLNATDVSIATGLPLRVVQETLESVRSQVRLKSRRSLRKARRSR